MRGALLHVTTGLLLGLALAGLIHAPSEVVAQHDARAPVVRPQPAVAGPWTQEQTIRVSPRLERALERRRRELLAPPRIQPRPSLRSLPSLAPAATPPPPAAIPIALTPDPPRVARRLEPDPPDAAPPPPAPTPATPPPPAKPVASTPQATLYQPASHDDDDDDNDGGRAKRKEDKRGDRDRDHRDRDHDDRGDRDRDDDHDRGDRGDDDDD